MRTENSTRAKHSLTCTEPVESLSPDDAGVSLRGLPVDDFDVARTVQVPEAQRAVNRPADDARLIKLQARDGVLMTMQCLHADSTERPHLTQTHTDICLSTLCVSNNYT